jgi:hypothetical protein
MIPDFLKITLIIEGMLKNLGVTTESDSNYAEVHITRV